MSEEVIIPKLPSESADFNSFIGDVIDLDGDGIPADELQFRLTPKNGKAATEDGRTFVGRRPDGRLAGTSATAAIPENRIVTTEQAEVVRGVNQRVEKFKQSEARLTDTASFLADVLGDGIPADELQFRLTPKNGKAATEDGRTFVGRRPDGRLVGTSATAAIPENRIVTTEQAEVVRGVNQRVEKFKQSEARLTDTASFLADVLGDGIPADELQFRLTPKNGKAATEDGRTFVGRRPDGRLVGASATAAIPENRIVTTEQAEVVRFIAASTQERSAKATAAQASTFAAEVVTSVSSIEDVATKARKLGIDDTVIVDLQALFTLKGSTVEDGLDAKVVEYLKTGDDTELIIFLDSMRMKNADVSGTSAIDADLRSIESYVQTARRIGLRSQFWQSFNGGLNPDAGLRLLEEYEAVDVQDTALVKELRIDSLKARRDGLIFEAFKQLASDQPDYMAVSIFLGGAAKSIATLEDQPGQKILQQVVETAYQNEVNAFFNKLVGGLELDRSTIAAAVEAAEKIPPRPAIFGVEFFDKFSKAKEEFLFIADKLDEFAFEQELVDLKKRFIKDPDVAGLVKEVLSLPGDEPQDMELRQELLDELAFFISVQRGINPGRFIALKSVVVEGVRSGKSDRPVEIDLTERNIERNATAARRLVGRFQKAIMPLFESLRGRKVGEQLTKQYISGRTGDRDLFTQRVKELEKQRPLTPIEQAYLESVQLMTVFNPHLIALAKEAPELTSLYLESYFQTLDSRTKQELVPDMYIPNIQIGLGPNGLAAAGELSRVNPELAAQTLFIDAAPQPGGPFGVPKGQAWSLNSANSIQDTTNVLPDIIDADREGVSVRAQGSPLVAFPGERTEGSDVRQGSINVTVDYLLNPDNISGYRQYPTNVDLARVLQLQAAMLVDNAMLSTRLVKVEGINDGRPGNKRLTLEYTTASGESITTTVRTDSLIVSSGLGEPTYGLSLEGSGAAEILSSSNTTDDGFPKLTDTIGAFEVLSRPEGDPVTPEGTIVIYGGGNSADVLIEYLGRQFESGNSSLNKIQKVIIVTSKDLSQRPRYASINDLKTRNGQPSFLEVVDGKVSDVVEQADGSLHIIGQDGQPIVAGINGRRGPIRADHVIAASGFRPQLDEIFEPLLSEGESLNRRKGLSRVTLPDNPGVVLANELASDPDIIFVGTASETGFSSESKLAQLPDLAREALLRNGAENAVAIGFRTPDTRAAVRQKFTGKVASAESELRQQSPEVSIDVGTSEQINPFPLAINPVLPEVRRDIPKNTDTLTALFLQFLPKITVSKDGRPLAADDPSANQKASFFIKFDSDKGEIMLTTSDESTPVGLQQALERAITNPYFQAYALEALSERRDPNGINVQLSFSRGRLVYSDNGKRSRKGRSYVEIV